MNFHCVKLANYIALINLFIVIVFISFSIIICSWIILFYYLEFGQVILMVAYC